jgi:hypothetical protein
MQAQYTKDDIMRKVKALLANAQDHKGKNEHLAAAFAVKAQQLMQQWNIQENELHTENSSVGFVEYTFKSNRKWQKQLLNSICSTNFCKMVWGRRGTLAWIFGTEINIQFCLELFEYLLKEITPLAEGAFWAYLGRIRELTTTRQAYNTNFYTGCADMISVRLYDQFQAAQGLSEQKRTEEDTEVDQVVGLIDAPDPSKMRALVVVQDKAVSEKLNEVFPEIKGERNYFDSKQRSKRAGYADGVRAGQQVAINKLVN